MTLFTTTPNSEHNYYHDKIKESNILPAKKHF